MISSRSPRRYRGRAAWRSGTYFATATLLIATPAPALAHKFGVGQDAYEDFLSGNQAVFSDIPVLLLMVAAGLLSGIWKQDGVPSLWPFYLVVIGAGAMLGLLGVVPPTLPAYGAVIATGLLGAAALRMPTTLMRGIIAVIGVIAANAVLSGHLISEISPFAYLGIAFALNVGIAVSAGVVAISREKLPYNWVVIAWRAGTSWLVAIAVMAMVLMMKAAA